MVDLKSEVETWSRERETRGERSRAVIRRGHATKNQYSGFWGKSCLAVDVPAGDICGAMSGRINRFEDLHVYQEACALDEALVHETKNWPKEEKFALIDQIRRSSRSIGANIAESWAKRRYPAHFVSKLSDADGELQETTHWLGRANRYGYLGQSLFNEPRERAEAIGRKLGKMISKPEAFA